ncbi:ribulose-phosphate 3-epimerase [Pseudoclavibacter chungangensis]|uniref:Ribulose-phosphate 3-epimerase n=1 Tax=Pseudoclavibacter chungangensis TaxID=587635 RepID=A0A7J5BU75_9MICO|nr:ribulose-phosphate 3-epimerase [Pseudoclavibacter chungangensis]KAB1657837.1 ribulose-phosphate 3-epimerase [Pseudoclavibacter chungangensis]NYJ66563.1 ribulose-phosphate 3-epimerase [Pseudoclavibacter chungangensis]
MGARINPSLLAADFASLGTELERISSADAAHVDVMDGHFVPNLTIGVPVVERLQAVSPVPLDLHLMIEDPDRWALDYADLGVWSITFHAEAVTAPVTLARRLREKGVRAGIAIRPGTPFEAVEEIIGSFDQLLVMTVEPGFGGQSFMPETMPKLRRAAEYAKRTGLELQLQVDGGITSDTIGIAAEHGADTFVAGSAVFRGEPSERIAELRAAAAAHAHGTTTEATTLSV